MAIGLSPALIARYRSVALDRIEKIEAGWVVLARQGHLPELEGTVLRELHTLKGESAVGGFADAATLCQAIEELFLVARERRFVITDDMDILATMAMQFLFIVVRRKDDGPLDGIDLPRFIGQIDELVAEERKASRRARAHSSGVVPPAMSAPPILEDEGALADLSAETGHLSLATRRRLARRLVALYAETSALAPAHERTCSAWRALAVDWASLESVPLEALLEPHLAAAVSMASASGVDVEVLREGLDLRISVDVVDALTTFVLHVVRNAIVHGLETRAEREASGKRPVGALRISASLRRETLEVTVSDDGRGVSHDAVFARATALGIVTDRPTDDAILRLLFAPGFSTADAVSELAGRGVGLDAVLASVREIGGSVAVSSTRGHGARFSASVPCPTFRVDVHRFRAPSGLLFAFPASWAFETVGIAGVDALDPLALCGVVAPLERERASAAPAMALHFRRGDVLIKLIAMDPPTLSSGLRLLVTPHTEPELIAIGDALAILLRPELVARASLRPPGA